MVAQVAQIRRVVGPFLSVSDRLPAVSDRLSPAPLQCAIYPMEVAKTRMAVAPKGYYQGARERARESAEGRGCGGVGSRCGVSRAFLSAFGDGRGWAAIELGHWRWWRLVVVACLVVVVLLAACGAAGPVHCHRTPPPRAVTISLIPAAQRGC